MTNTEPDSEDIACAEYDRDTALGIKGHVVITVHPEGGADMKWVRGEAPPPPPPKEPDGFATIASGTTSVADNAAAHAEFVTIFPKDNHRWYRIEPEKYVGQNE